MKADTKAMIENLSLIRLGIALALMSYAAVLDWRTRRVANWVWMLMGSIAIALLFLELLYWDMVAGSPILTVEGNSITGFELTQPAIYLIFIPICIFFFDVFWDRKPVYHEGKINFLPILLYAIAFISMALMVHYAGLDNRTMALLAIPVMIIVFTIFYYARLIHGGADAKAFMALAILFPYYPIIQGFPLIEGPAVSGLSIAFPFAFLILMNAAILQVVTVPLGMFLKNLANRDFGFPEMFLGYRMDIVNIPKKFVWPMEKIIDDERVLVIFPKRDGDVKEDLKPLRELGIERIWVTPKVPFIIPMLLGIIISVFVGNLILLLF